MSNLLVPIAEGKHPVPFRTRKLSPPAPKILTRGLVGKIGRCQEVRHFYFDSDSFVKDLQISRLTEIFFLNKILESGD